MVSGYNKLWHLPAMKVHFYGKMVAKTKIKMPAPITNIIAIFYLALKH